ncbi:hypothetical protein G6F32_015128 [Rhizopus arrhizus]|nr:hypothetical protein G6F32_015128 [Rhizopus arrhizus]
MISGSTPSRNGDQRRQQRRPARDVQAVEKGFLHQRLVEERAEVAHREAAVGVHEGAVEHRAHGHGQEKQQKAEHQQRRQYGAGGQA